MAAEAASTSDSNDQSVNESKSSEASKRPNFVQSLSRTSVTFFSGENASHIAHQKFDALKSAVIEDAERGGGGGEKEEEVAESEKEADQEKKVITHVLNHCVGGKFDLATRYVFSEPFCVLVFLELVDSVSAISQHDLLSTLQSLLKNSIKNYQACTKVGLIPHLLKRISKYEDDKVADKAIDLIGDLATYSINVRELKCFFSALQRTEDRKWPPHALKLLQILKKMPEKHGPDVYFNFSGKRGAVITVPPIARWPHQPGFTFVTWLQLDAAHLSPSEQSNRPHVYCFVNSRGLGYTAHFSGPMLVIEVWGKNGKKQTLLVKSKFEPQIWYHLCISHTYNRFKSSEIKVFVNGQMVTSGDATMPVNKEPTDKCFIGGSHMSDTLHIFKGQMSAIYIFAEPLSYNTVIALYRLGPGYKGQFKFINELESTIADTDKKLIYDGKLAQSLLFTYNPKAVDGEICLESSPTENQSCFYHSPHALMMDGVQAVVTHSLQAAMHSLGGIQMLFPLFTQLDCLLDDADTPNPKICSILLGLIYDLLRGSSVCQQQMIQSQGFMIIGHLLQKSSPVHLTEETVDILLGLARFFMATESAQGLLGGLLDHVLLEPSMWIKTPLALQSNLLSLFATGYVGGLDYAGYIRKEVGVARLILILRKYYSVNSQQNTSSVEEIISLRAFVLLLIKQMIIKDDGITGDELKSILVYLAVEEEEENHLDVIQLLLSVMCEKPATIIPCFDQMEGFQVFFKLLVATNEQIRVCSLKILCAYMQQLPVKRKLELVDQYGFISKLGEKLSIFDMTMSTYNALFEFLTARPTKIISEKRHAQPDSSYIMYHPTVLPIVVNLLLAGHAKEEQRDEVKELTLVFLSDLTILLNSNNDNKRLLLQLMCWQDWLFSLSDFDPNKESKISDSVFSIIKMLLSYAIQHEKEGWRVWVDTLSILHSKISTFNVKCLQEPQKNMEQHEPSPPHVICNEESKTYIDQETGEEVGKPTQHASPEKVTVPATDGEENKSPSDSDTRKMFFEKLLKGGSTSVISGQMDSIRKAQSLDNLNTDATVEEIDGKEKKDKNSPKLNDRPRSASPSLPSSRNETKNTNDDGEDIDKSTTDEQVKDTESVDNREESVKSTEDVASEPDSIDSPLKLPLSKRLSSDSKVTNYAKDNLPSSPSAGGDGSDVDSDQADNGSSVPQSPASSEKSKCRPFLDIPEFSWSPAHQKLLTELLFSIEKDIQVWKTHTRKSITDFVSMRENSMYIINLCHMVSILSDSLIFCCGGLLPLMASATSTNFENDVLEACGGMELESAFSFMNRVLNVVDIIAFASSINFASVETHRNMSAGGVLRQCIRLVFCGAARNRVVCRQRERPSKSGHLHPKTLKETQEAIKTLIASTKPPTEEVSVQNIPGHMTTITDPDKLLQDSDINRLRALVYRESEDNRQSQYVALVVIYFVAVLMVARYRDVLEHDLSEDISKPSTGSSDASSESSRSRAGTVETLSLDDRIEIIFNTSANLLREILFDFSHYLSKVLVGSRNQDLISEGLGSLKSEESTVELVMLLCSQEWQNALQRMAGTAFMDLVDEGRLLSHATRERIVITGSEARDIMGERDNFESLKHAQFETVCTRTVINCIEQYRTYDHFFKAKKKRNNASATQSLEKIFDVLTSEFGAWSMPEVQGQTLFYKLDRWEDMHRRRYRTIKNPYGTSHPEATLRPGSAE
ncbi:lipopolysaccharide-responsive and beige-like anchor protein, partial [Clytia hemisphaerica]|uniref:Lipopolysaccharide-responsive and beige-like anchor protein n=1 Tax=Clytia hemisphaerica TaxID=252671 RepID=A0A7M5XGL0_9CNID